MQLIKRIWGSVRKALPKALKTCLWLFKIILPISLLVRLLQYSGLLDLFSGYLNPVFSGMGLPGETAIIFLTSIFTPLYAPIALITSMSLSVREATILAMMCLISHNLFVECSIQAKTGSSWIGMFILRIVMSFVAAFSLNAIMPQYDALMGQSGGSAVACNSLGEVFLLWAESSLSVIVTILWVVTALMILHYVLEEFKLMRKLSGYFKPLMRVFGLSDNSAMLWLIGNMVGLAYGGAIMIEQIDEKQITLEESDLLNYHLAMSHSLLEDSLIFSALGIPVFWVVAPRIVFAMAVVWTKRFLTNAREQLLQGRFKTRQNLNR